MAKQYDKALDNSPLLKDSVIERDYTSVVGEENISIEDENNLIEETQKQNVEQPNEYVEPQTQKEEEEFVKKERQKFKFAEKDVSTMDYHKLMREQTQQIQQDEQEELEDQQQQGFRPSSGFGSGTKSDFDIPKEDIKNFVSTLLPLGNEKMGVLLSQFAKIHITRLKIVLEEHQVPKHITETLITVFTQLNVTAECDCKLTPDELKSLKKALIDYMQWKKFEAANPGTALITVIIIIAVSLLSRFLQSMMTNQALLKHYLGQLDIDIKEYKNRKEKDRKPLVNDDEEEKQQHKKAA